MRNMFNVNNNHVVTGRKLHVHKTFRRLPGSLLNVLYTFNFVLCLWGKTPERRHWRRSGVFIVDFEHILHLVEYNQS